MKSLFSEEGLSRIRDLLARKTLFGFDFDGTLAKVVAAPEAAVLERSVSSALARLALRYPVAVISGRSVADLQRRLRFVPPHLVGNHGLEGNPSVSTAELERFKECSRRWASYCRIMLSSPELGIFIEDKMYSLALHYRGAIDKDLSLAWIRETVRDCEPAPRVVPGKFVVNLVPSDSPNKGAAMESLIKHVGAEAAFFIGDDHTDEDVFALDRPLIVTAKVGNERPSKAQYFLEKQTEIKKFLIFLLTQKTPII